MTENIDEKHSMCLRKGKPFKCKQFYSRICKKRVQNYLVRICWRKLDYFRSQTYFTCQNMFKDNLSDTYFPQNYNIYISMSIKLLSETQIQQNDFPIILTSFSRFEVTPSLQTQKQPKGTQIDYISQFLELPLESFNSHIKDAQKPPEHSDQMENQKQQNLMEEATENSTTPKINKSIFHNFQKQLVITLKSKINFDNFNLKKCPAAVLSRQIWNLFLQSKYYSKRILHNIFGVSNCLKDDNPEQKKDVLPDFIEIFRRNTAQEITQAQRYLREAVIRQGMKLKTKDIFSKRKMQKTPEFEQYFFSFLQELQLGPMNRRMPKLSKLEVLEYITKIKDENNP